MERLERILIKSPFDQYDEKFLVDLEDMNWLVDTVEEHQKEIERLKDYSQKSANVALLAELENENARLREALEFYAESEKHIDPYAYGEFGEKARQALKE